MKKQRRPGGARPKQWDTPLLAVGLAFLAGGLLGCGMALKTGEGGNSALAGYIQNCLQIWNGNGRTVSLPLLVWETVRFPAAAAALGFTALGVVGIPVLFFARGFLLAFSISSFVGIFGVSGGWMAFLLLGASGVAAVAPLFLLGRQGFAASRALLRRFLGGRREGVVYTRAYFALCGGCALFLLCCILFDYFAVPVLLRLILAGHV